MAGRDSAQAAPVAADRIDGWFFDFDNTLAVLEPNVDWAASRRELENFLRGEGAPADLFAEFPRGNLLLYDALRRRIESNDQTGLGPRLRDRAAARALLECASRIIERYELAAVESTPALPGAAELLRALHTRARTCAIVTSNSSRTVGRWLERTGLAHAIALTVGRDSLMALKPAPDMLRHALRSCAVAPERALLMGDSEPDLRAARALNVRFTGVAANSEARRRLEAAGASEVFDSPAAVATHFGLLGTKSGLCRPS